MSSSANSWLFDDEDFQHTPSRADGITYERETYERAYGVDLIVRVGSVRINVWVITFCNIQQPQKINSRVCIFLV